MGGCRDCLPGRLQLKIHSAAHRGEAVGHAGGVCGAGSAADGAGKGVYHYGGASSGQYPADVFSQWGVVSHTDVYGVWEDPAGSLRRGDLCLRGGGGKAYTAH